MAAVESDEDVYGWITASYNHIIEKCPATMHETGRLPEDILTMLAMPLGSMEASPSLPGGKRSCPPLWMCRLFVSFNHYRPLQ